MKKILLLSACAIFVLCSCKETKKETDDLLIKMYFGETRCANPWEALPNSANYIEEVKTYLEEEKIPVESIRVQRLFDAPPYGECSTPSGRKIYIEVFEKYEKSAAALGFISYQ